jgi:hypothetical protein
MRHFGSKWHGRADSRAPGGYYGYYSQTPLNLGSADWWESKGARFLRRTMRRISG